MATRTSHLVDLISQGRAVERLLTGLAPDMKLAWLARHGEVSSRLVQDTLIHDFRSHIGRECVFRFDGDELLFVGDHVWFRGPE